MTLEELRQHLTEQLETEVDVTRTAIKDGREDVEQDYKLRGLYQSGAGLAASMNVAAKELEACAKRLPKALESDIQKCPDVAEFVAMATEIIGDRLAQEMELWSANINEDTKRTGFWSNSSETMLGEMAQHRAGRIRTRLAQDIRLLGSRTRLQREGAPDAAAKTQELLTSAADRVVPLAGDVAGVTGTPKERAEQLEGAAHAAATEAMSAARGGTAYQDRTRRTLLWFLLAAAAAIGLAVGALKHWF